MIGINIPMPKDCGNCPCSDFEYFECKITEKRLEDGIFEDCMGARPPWCPLIDLSQYEDDRK